MRRQLNRNNQNGRVLRIPSAWWGTLHEINHMTLWWLCQHADSLYYGVTKVPTRALCPKLWTYESVYECTHIKYRNHWFSATIIGRVTWILSPRGTPDFLKSLVWWTTAITRIHKRYCYLVMINDMLFIAAPTRARPIKPTGIWGSNGKIYTPTLSSKL